MYKVGTHFVQLKLPTLTPNMYMMYGTTVIFHLTQAAGETLFTNDIPKQSDELTAAIVTSTVAKATIHSIDTAEAMVKFYTLSNS